MSGTGTGRKRARKWTHTQAEQELAAGHTSGKTQAAFARERGYSKKRLSNWHGRMRARDQGCDRLGSVMDDRPALVPVRVVNSQPVVADRGMGSSPIEVELRNGVLVRVLADFDPGAFERVLAVVSRC